MKRKSSYAATHTEYFMSWSVLTHKKNSLNEKLKKERQVVSIKCFT